MMFIKLQFSFLGKFQMLRINDIFHRIFIHNV